MNVIALAGITLALIHCGAVQLDPGLNGFILIKHVYISEKSSFVLEVMGENLPYYIWYQTSKKSMYTLLGENISQRRNSARITAVMLLHSTFYNLVWISSRACNTL